MCQARGAGLLQHRIQYASGDAYHPLPGSSHVRCMRRIEVPRTALFIQELLHSGCMGIGRQAPMKLVPQSERICLAGPRRAKNLLRAFMKVEESMLSISSMCMARVLIQVKRMAHLLLWACPPRVRRVTTVHGPNASSPMYVNGGSVLRRSMGRSAIFCSVAFPRSLLHITHL